MPVFIGVDLGWYGKPSGLASIVDEPRGLRLRRLDRIEDPACIARWIHDEAGSETAVAAVDAPLVIPNPSGIRSAERDLNRDYRRFDAGCHAANLGRPFAGNVVNFSAALAALGFQHGPNLAPRQPGRFQIEIHPHAAAVNLFRLPRIVKYKRGPRVSRAAGLRRLRSLALKHLPALDPPLHLRLPSIPRVGPMKPVEDRIDAVLCAYVAAHWWYWGTARNRCYGSESEGYIVVPLA